MYIPYVIIIFINYLLFVIDVTMKNTVNNIIKVISTITNNNKIHSDNILNPVVIAYFLVASINILENKYNPATSITEIIDPITDFNNDPLMKSTPNQLYHIIHSNIVNFSFFLLSYIPFLLKEQCKHKTNCYK